jgi:hypothetical protein
VVVGAGQDCVGDAFHPFGAVDRLQVAPLVAHAAQLRTSDEIAAALSMVIPMPLGSYGCPTTASCTGPA